MDNDSAIRTASKQILNQELSYEDKFIQQYKISNPDHYELITDKIKQLKEETKTETFKIKNDRQNILAKSVKTKKEFEVKRNKSNNIRMLFNFEKT
jgi:exopolyphosphatase/pppGpp-phosphohydrolase